MKAGFRTQRGVHAILVSTASGIVAERAMFASSIARQGLVSARGARAANAKANRSGKIARIAWVADCTSGSVTD